MIPTAYTKNDDVSADNRMLSIPLLSSSPSSLSWPLQKSPIDSHVGHGRCGDNWHGSSGGVSF